MLPLSLALALAAITAPAFAVSETIPAFEDGAAAPIDPNDACGSANLYERPGDPLADIPIYEQGETDLCYAYTTAQMTEYYLRKSGAWNAEDHVNPLWIAIAYKGGHQRGIRIRKNELGHGFFHTAFKDMAELGICRPKVFEKALLDYKTMFADQWASRGREPKRAALPTLSDPDFFYLYEAIWDERARSNRFFTMKMNRERSREEFKEYFTAIKKLAERDDFQRISNRAFSNLLVSTSRKTKGGDPITRILTTQGILERELRQIHRIIMEVPGEWITKRKKIRYLHDVVFQACTKDDLLKPELPDVKSVGLGWGSNRRLKKAIDRMLDAADPQPVGIGYCSRIWNEEDGKAAKGGKRNALLPRIAKALSKRCSAHYSMVVGRRKDPKSGGCQYLVRNTYGRDFWTRRYECLCERTDRNGFESCRYSAATPTTDRVVGCWIDEKPMLNSLFDVSALRKRDLAPVADWADPPTAPEGAAGELELED